MSKTNDTSKLGHAKFKNRRTLAEGELDAVTGGQRSLASLSGLIWFSVSRLERKKDEQAQRYFDTQSLRE